MGSRRKHDDGDDGTAKHKKPNNFWAPFNTWWREHHERTGNRATVLEMREWYVQNAHIVWPPVTMPTVEDMLKIAKGLRTIKQVQAYFRSYRKNLKTRKEIEPASPDSACRRAVRRHVATTRAIGAAAAGSFLAAVQQAAHRHQQHSAAAAAAVAAAAASGSVAAGAFSYPDAIASANGGYGEASPASGEHLPFMEWGFSSEAAAAAAMEAIAEDCTDGDEALSDVEEDLGRAHKESSPQDHAAHTETMRAARHAGSIGGLSARNGGGSGDSGYLASGTMTAVDEAATDVGLPFRVTARKYDDGLWHVHNQLYTRQQQHHHQQHQHHQQQQQHHHQQHHHQQQQQSLAAQNDISPRRFVRSMRTSLGAGARRSRHSDNSNGTALATSAAAVAVCPSDGRSGGACMQRVTGQRVHGETCGGRPCKQETTEREKQGVAQGFSVPYGTAPKVPCHQSVKLVDGPFTDGSGATASAAAATAAAASHGFPTGGATGMGWHAGRSAFGGDVSNGAVGGGSSASSASLTATGGSALLPPRKKVKGVVSMGGGEVYASPPLRSVPFQDARIPSYSVPDTAVPSADSSGVPLPLRRLPHSYGGHSISHPSSYGPRTKAASSHGGSGGGSALGTSSGACASGMTSVALSDGGVAYGSQLPTSSQHANAPPAYRGAASSYGVMAGSWHPHTSMGTATQHQLEHQQLYLPYPMYGYRHSMLGYPHALPSYAYSPVGPAALPPYHVAQSYHLYGTQTSSYGQYYHPHHVTDLGGISATDLVAIGRMEDVSQQQQQQQRRPARQQQHGHPVAVDDTARAPVPQPSHINPLQRQPQPQSQLQPQDQSQLQTQPRSQPRPLQLTELPPLTAAVGVGACGTEALSSSDLVGLSGLSTLGLPESDIEGEETASTCQQPTRHSTLHPESHHTHPPPQMSPQRTTGAILCTTGAAPTTSELVQETQVHSLAQQPQQQQHAVCGGMHSDGGGQLAGESQRGSVRRKPEGISIGCEHATAQNVDSLPPTAGVDFEPPRHDMHQPQHQSQQPQQPQQLQEQGVVGATKQPPIATVTTAAASPSESPRNQRNKELLVHSFSSSPAAAVAAAAAAALASTLTTDAAGEQQQQQLHTAIDLPEEGSFPTASDGGATDGAASVYYKNPKTSSTVQWPMLLPTGPNSLQMPPSSVPQHPHRYLHHLHHHHHQQHHQHHQHLPELMHSVHHTPGEADPFSSSAATRATVVSAPLPAPLTRTIISEDKPRGGAPRPLTVHVLQEELMMPLPYAQGSLALLGGMGGGSCGPGDLSALHSPSGSFNLLGGLLDHGPEDGGELGLWAPCG